jgi:DNA-binding NtrC family response regulator
MADMEQEILIVDDELSGGEVVAEILSKEGHRPWVFTHPEEALASFEKGRFSLAFVDINLPAMSGLELASRLKKIDPPMEIVFMTGYGTFDNAVEAIKIGAYDYLRKPFGINELKLCLRRFEERQSGSKYPFHHFCHTRRPAPGFHQQRLGTDIGLYTGRGHGGCRVDS